ncbi:MAG: LysM peptidoglycan-binding domain-containing protein [Firmicutes bacterium]|nr:LysM peptidoglycan-binding domain-containing protein [Bacillota bacterium]
MMFKSRLSSVSTAPLPIGYLKAFLLLLLIPVFFFWPSPAVPVIAADSQTQYASYTVVSGDSLYKIALKYKTTVDTLRGLNNLASTSLKVGQLLKVPVVTDPSTADYYHIVKSGDTLYLIAQHFGTTVNGLMTANSLTSTTVLINQALLLPSNSLYIEYMVQSGNTLATISTAFSTTVDKIKTLNSLTSDTIYIGQTLLVPRKTSTAAAATISTSPTLPAASWVVPNSAVLVHVASGQTAWDLVNKYKPVMPRLKTPITCTRISCWSINPCLYQSILPTRLMWLLLG